MHTVYDTLFVPSTVIQTKRLEAGTAYLTWQPYHRLLNDFTYNPSDSVNITREGRYKLSLQITYACRQSGSPHSFLSHRVVLYSDSYPTPQIILNVYESVNMTGPWFKSMFSEVFYAFDLGDVIRVESDNPELIDIVNDPTTKNILNIQFISAIPDV